MLQGALLRDPTRVTFPGRSTSGRSPVVLARNLGDASGGSLVFAEETPFHPVDNVWPDQPADYGTLIADGREFRITDALTAAARLDSGDVFVGTEIPVRRGEPGWIFLVAHLVDFPADFNVQSEGVDVTFNVDADRRNRLSIVHSACHFMALALNKATATMWRKDSRKDSLGNPNLDQLAIQSSTIGVEESVDHYRLGKSCRKQGFDADVFLKSLHEVQAEAGIQNR
jgi:alanyl-tRNA synthetase